MNEAPPTRRTDVLRWVVGLVIVGALAFVGYVVYRHQFAGGDAALSGRSVDKRVEEFLADGDQSLINGDLEAAREHYLKASGLTERDPRVRRGLARIEISHADRAWWAWLAAVGANGEKVDGARKTLTDAVTRAQQAIDEVVDKPPTDSASRQLAVDRMRLEAMVIYALAHAGQKDAAKAALEKLAARHRGHRGLDALQVLVESAGQPLEAKSEADAGSAPDAAPSATVPGRRTTEHFEFDHEPIPPVTTPGELEWPSQSDPAPVDTSDLP